MAFPHRCLWQRRPLLLCPKYFFYHLCRYLSIKVSVTFFSQTQNQVDLQVPWPTRSLKVTRRELVCSTVNFPFRFPLSSHPAAPARGESSMTNFSSKACAYISISRDQTNRLLMGNWNSGKIPRWNMNQETVWLLLFFFSILEDVSRHR